MTPYVIGYLVLMFATLYASIGADGETPDCFEEWFIHGLTAILWPLTWTVVTVIATVLFAKDRWQEFRFWLARRASKGCKAMQLRQMHGWMQVISKDRYPYSSTVEIVDQYSKLYLK